MVLDGVGEAGQLSLIAVAFEPLSIRLWVVLGGVGEAGQVSLIGVAFISITPFLLSPFPEVFHIPNVDPIEMAKRENMGGGSK